MPYFSMTIPKTKYQFKCPINDQQLGQYPHVCGSTYGYFTRKDFSNSVALDRYKTRRTMSRNASKLNPQVNTNQVTTNTQAVLGMRPFNGIYQDNQSGCPGIRGGIGRKYRLGRAKTCNSSKCGVCGDSETSNPNNNVRYVSNYSDYIMARRNIAITLESTLLIHPNIDTESKTQERSGSRSLSRDTEPTLQEIIPRRCDCFGVDRNAKIDTFPLDKIIPQCRDDPVRRRTLVGNSNIKFLFIDLGCDFGSFTNASANDYRLDKAGLPGYNIDGYPDWLVEWASLNPNISGIDDIQWPCIGDFDCSSLFLGDQPDGTTLCVDASGCGGANPFKTIALKSSKRGGGAVDGLTTVSGDVLQFDFGFTSEFNVERFERDNLAGLFHTQGDYRSTGGGNFTPLNSAINDCDGFTKGDLVKFSNTCDARISFTLEVDKLNASGYAKQGYFNTARGIQSTFLREIVAPLDTAGGSGFGNDNAVGGFYGGVGEGDNGFFEVFDTEIIPPGGQSGYATIVPSVRLTTRGANLLNRFEELASESLATSTGLDGQTTIIGVSQSSIDLATTRAGGIVNSCELLIDNITVGFTENEGFYPGITFKMASVAALNPQLSFGYACDISDNIPVGYSSDGSIAYTQRVLTFKVTEVFDLGDKTGIIRKVEIIDSFYTDFLADDDTWKDWCDASGDEIPRLSEPTSGNLNFSPFEVVEVFDVREPEPCNCAYFWSGTPNLPPIAPQRAKLGGGRGPIGRRVINDASGCEADISGNLVKVRTAMMGYGGAQPGLPCPPDSTPTDCNSCGTSGTDDYGRPAYPDRCSDKVLCGDRRGGMSGASPFGPFVLTSPFGGGGEDFHRLNECPLSTE